MFHNLNQNSKNTNNHRSSFFYDDLITEYSYHTQEN